MVQDKILSGVHGGALMNPLQALMQACSKLQTDGE